MEFDAVLQRRTIRLFQQKMVPDDEIRYLIDAACLASCGANRQPLRYRVIRRPELVKAVFEHTRYAALVHPRRTPQWGISAPPVFIAVCAKNPSAVDAGAAIQSMEMAAWNHGIGCCWIGSFAPAEVNALLRADDLPVRYLVAVGYPAEDPVVERIGADGSPAYYLDDSDTLHVPKYSVDAVTTYWD